MCISSPTEGYVNMTNYHHLHYTLISDVPLPPTDLSSRLTGRATSPLPVASRTRTTCRQPCKVIRHFMVARLLTLLASFFLGSSWCLQRT
jgi:hypothetical protein